MAKPSIKNISTFDATKDTVVGFLYSGDNKVKATLSIYNTSDITTPVATVTTDYIMVFKITIPAGTLTNGVKYCAELVCTESDGTTVSAVSNKTYFQCLSTPSFSFEGITSGYTVTSTSLYTSVKMVSDADEDGKYQTLIEYTFHLYDATKNLVYSSDTKYSLPVEYTFRDLDNQTQYYIRCTGITDKSINVDTGYVDIFIDFTNPSSYSLVYTSVDTRTGVVNYSSNFSVLEPNEDTSDYDLANSCVDLRDNKTITYTVSPNEDFTLGIKVQNFEGEILVLSDGSKKITLSRMDVSDTQFVFKLVIPNGNTYNVIYSGKLNYHSEEFYIAYIRRVNGVFKMYTTDAFDQLLDNNYWFAREIEYPSGITLEVKDNYITYDTSMTYISKDDLEIYVADEEPDANNEFAIWLDAVEITDTDSSKEGGTE